MRVITRAVWDSIDDFIEGKPPIYEESYDWDGPVELACGGASAQQNEINATQTALQNQMSSAFNTYFGQYENILKGVTASLTPIVEAGPGQYGFSAAEDASLRAQSTENIAQAGREATDVARSTMAAQGGGNIYLPTGTQEAVEGALATKEAEAQAAAENQITTEGYQTGRQNYETAVGELPGVAGALENPVTGAGEGASSAGNSAMQGATAITEANQAPLQALGGLVGGLAGTILNPVGTDIGSKLGKAITS
jgi:hypothetical protein